MKLCRHLANAFPLCVICPLASITAINLWDLQNGFTTVRQHAGNALVNEIQKNLIRRAITKPRLLKIIS
jgi:hypothetical protein